MACMCTCRPIASNRVTAALRSARRASWMLPRYPGLVRYGDSNAAVSPSSTPSTKILIASALSRGAGDLVSSREQLFEVLAAEHAGSVSDRRTLALSSPLCATDLNASKSDVADRCLDERRDAELRSRARSPRLRPASRISALGSGTLSITRSIAVSRSVPLGSPVRASCSILPFSGSGVFALMPRARAHASSPRPSARPRPTGSRPGPAPPDRAVPCADCCARTARVPSAADDPFVLGCGWRRPLTDVEDRLDGLRRSSSGHCISSSPAAATCTCES